MNRHKQFSKSFSALITPCAAMLSSAYVYAKNSVCAVVKIEIKQELTLERQAFDTMMKINNGLDTFSLEDVCVQVHFEDDAGNRVLASSDPNATDEIHWLSIPALESTVYYKQT